MSAHFERPRRVDMRSSFTQSYQVKLAPINLHVLIPVLRTTREISALTGFTAF